MSLVIVAAKRRFFEIINISSWKKLMAGLVNIGLIRLYIYTFPAFTVFLVFITGSTAMFGKIMM